MKLNILRKWVRALRSGRYKQGQGQLKVVDQKGNTRFCCLGVLCDLHSKQTGIKWQGIHYMDEKGVLPSRVMKWAGLKYTDPQLTIHQAAADLNDNGKRFKTIAKLIEKAQKEKRI
jgi:hypothetical protein